MSVGIRELKNGPHDHSLQVDVDISATRMRMAGLNHKFSEVRVKKYHEVKIYHVGWNKWLDREKG